MIDQIDELPIQPSDYEDLVWPGGNDGVDQDADGTEVRRTTTIHRNIQNVMRRPGHTYVAKINYMANYISGSRTSGPENNVTFTHTVYTDVNSGAAISTESYTQGLTNPPISLEVVLPSTATEITIGITIPNTQNDARLNIPNYRLDIVERVAGSDVSIDATGFNGNLATTDDDVQKVAQKLDDLTVGAGASGSTIVKEQH